MIDTVVFPKLGIQFTVDRVAFSIGGFAIYWYAICIITGVFLAILYASRRAKKFGLDPDRMFDVIIVGFIGAIVCARAYFVIFDSKGYDSFWDVINMRDGGLAIYGGLIGAVAFGYIMAKIRKLRFTPMLDLVGIGFLIGQALGRWGNFFNREAFGSNTNLPWGMTSADIKSYLANNRADIYDATGVTVVPGDPVHPTFLYESLWCALGFVLLHFYSKRRKFDGEVFLMYLAWYGAGRFVFEGLRTDSLMLGQLRISQLVAALCVAFAVLAIIIIRGRIRRSGEYVFYKDTEESKEFIARYEESLKKNKKSERALAEDKTEKIIEQAGGLLETMSLDPNAEPEEGGISQADIDDMEALDGIDSTKD